MRFAPYSSMVPLCVLYIIGKREQRTFYRCQTHVWSIQLNVIVVYSNCVFVPGDESRRWAAAEFAGRATNVDFGSQRVKQHWLFWYFITLLIVLLIWTTLLYTSISFLVSSTVHECFKSSFCPLLLLCKYCIIIIFKGCRSHLQPALIILKFGMNE